MPRKSLEVSCRITAPGGELELNDGQHYVLGADTGGVRQVQWRRQEASNSLVPGTFTVNAVQENVNEVVSVYIYGSDNGDMRRRLTLVTEAFSQHAYTLTWDYGEDVYAWYCQYADHSIDTRKEFQHARMALATFQVPRYPALIRV